MTTQSAENLAPAMNTSPRFRVTLRHVSLVLIAFGLLVSGYLSYAKLTNTATVCSVSERFDCGTVQNSRYSEIAGIPIAVLGFVMYATLGTLTLLQSRVAFLRENGMILIFGIALFAWMYSMYLVYLQWQVIGVFCQWCLAHEANMTVLFGVTLLRVIQSFSDDAPAA
jgi:uncharacterized membrane protein